MDNRKVISDPKVRTVTPFDVKVAGVRLKVWRNPYTRRAVMERTGACSPSEERAVEVVARWLESRVARFLGAGWQVVRGEGW